MAKRLNEFKVLTFDCYGTLIDWETGIWDALQPLFRFNAPYRPDRDAALKAFGDSEDGEERANPGHPYPQILEASHRGVAVHLGLKTTDALDEAFGASVPHWPAFADSANALRALKERYRLVILSNVHRDGFAASNAKLGVDFDAVYTAEDIGSYKPADANFDYLLARLRADFGLDREDVLHTAQSLFHDHAPANCFRIANAWIDRQRQSETGRSGATSSPTEMPRVDFSYFTLQEMADAVRADAG
ncbi:MAG: haloacid dehalogenase type II [Woeseiaceae bacterium]|nr:haloacid dehalogenase type II [Woeseiaceae bacterium]